MQRTELGTQVYKSLREASPLERWREIKSDIRAKLGEDSWELWIRDARLLRVLPCPHGYFAEIEHLYQRRRGVSTLLSPIDCLLIETWAAAGIGLVAVLRGIDAAFHGNLQINSLYYCDKQVLRAAEDSKEASVGARQENSRPTHCTTLLVALPPSGKKIFAALQHKPMLNELCRHAGMGLAFTVWPDEYQQFMALGRFGVEMEFMEKRTAEDAKEARA